MNYIEKIANEYGIPVITEQTKVWYFSTKSGQYYNEFIGDKFVGLGWNKLQVELFTDSNLTEKEKRRIIKECYPEKQAGSIMNQMEALYNDMKAGDFVVIPSGGSSVISTGRIGEVETINNNTGPNAIFEEGALAHRRGVNWVNIDAVNRDIYLLKELRTQSNVSDLSESGELIYRNMFPVYISDDGIHITLQKVSSDDFSLLQSLELENTFMQFCSKVGSLYGNDSFINEIHKKTAVGSPGFIEFILSHKDEAFMCAFILLNFIGMKKGPDGNISTGVIAIIEEISSIIDRRATRELTKDQAKKTLAEEAAIREQSQADANLKNAQAEVMREQSQADANLKNAQAREINSRIDSNSSDVHTTAEIDTGNSTILLPDPKEHIDEINAINELGIKLKEILEKSGIELISNEKSEDEKCE